MKIRYLVIMAAALFTMSGAANAGNPGYWDYNPNSNKWQCKGGSFCNGSPEGNGGNGGDGGDGGKGVGVGIGVGVGVGIANAESNASADASATAISSNKNTNTNINHNTNQQQQGQVQGQQQGQTQTATGGNATANGGNAVSGSYSQGGSVSVGDTTLTTGPSTSSATGGAVNIADGAVQNTNSNTAVGGVGMGGEGGSVTIGDGAVENNSSATASTGDVVVNNNFGGEDGNGALANQTVGGSTQTVEGSDTNIQIDTRTDFRGAPVASVAPVFSTACSGGMSFQARDLGVSVGDAEHYCKLLQLADARYAQAHTIILDPPAPPVLSDCTGNVPDYTKGSRADTEMQKQATVSCFRQNQAAMEEYAVVVEAYNQASAQRTYLLDQAYTLVNDAEEYVRSQRLTSNIGEQSRKLMYPALLIKAVAILFF